MPATIYISFTPFKPSIGPLLSVFFKQNAHNYQSNTAKNPVNDDLQEVKGHQQSYMS